MNPPPVGTTAIVGCGLVGIALAERLAVAGYDVLGIDVRDEARDGLARIGVRATDSSAEAAECRLVILAVYDAEQAASAIKELSALATGDRTIACVTTLNPEQAASLAAAAAPGAWFIETPISGTSAEIAAGEALGLVAGEPELFKRHSTALKAMVGEWRHVGVDVGSAAKAKLAINLVLEINRSAVAEGLAFAASLGLDEGKFADLLVRSAAASRVMTRKLPKMLARDFAPEGRCAQSLKDVLTMQDCARMRGLDLTLLAAQAGLLARAVKAGDGDLDGAVVLRHLAEAAERISA